MELYEQIRREYEHGAGTIRAVARKFGVHRREVRKALKSALPPERKIPERERSKLAAAIPFIDGILESDRKAPRKQRHTAHRIWTRMRREMPEVEVAESTVRRYVREKKAWFGWVGDSRGYLWRRGELHPTTSDHSLLNELIKTGRLSDEEIANFQHKNVITRALGMADQTEVDVSAWDLETGDVCLVCCDGLTGMVTDERIAEILSKESELQKACQQLVDEANANGGIDNITVALVRVAA